MFVKIIHKEMRTNYKIIKWILVLPKNKRIKQLIIKKLSIDFPL